MRLALVAVLACKSDEPIEPIVEVQGTGTASDVVTGSLTVEGKAAVLGACKPGYAAHVFVELETNLGKLRFEDQRLYWNPVADAPTRGELLSCAKLDRSWGGGVRVDAGKSAYWRGTLAFRCGAIAGELTLDCGGITATERAQLDGQRQQLRDDQRGSGSQR